MSAGSVTRVIVPFGTAVGGAPRGSIAFWSEASRRRLWLAVEAVDWRAVRSPLLVTLTLPGDRAGGWRPWCKDGGHFKRMWKALTKRWGREFREAPRGVWKLEFQGRKAPHLHVVVEAPKGVPLSAVRAWVARAWWEVVGSGCPDHLAAGTQVDQVHDLRAVGPYMAGYLSRKRKGYQERPPEGFAAVGRWWGFFGGLAPVWQEMDLSLGQAVRLRRILRGLRGAQARGRRRRYRGRRRRGVAGMVYVSRGDADRLRAQLAQVVSDPGEV